MNLSLNARRRSAQFVISYATMKQIERCDVRARWHLGKEKKNQDSRDVVRCANILPSFLEFFSSQARKTRAFSSGLRNDDARAFLLWSRSSTVVRVRQPVSSRPAFRRLSWHLGISSEPAFYSGYLRVFPAHVPAIKVVVFASSGAF